MKPVQFFTSLSLAILCVCLALALILLAHSNAGLQEQLALQQQQISRGSVSQQIGMNLIRDMASIAPQDDAMRDILKKNGFSVTVNSNPSSPAPSPTK